MVTGMLAGGSKGHVTSCNCRLRPCIATADTAALLIDSKRAVRQLLLVLLRLRLLLVLLLLLLLLLRSHQALHVLLEVCAVFLLLPLLLHLLLHLQHSFCGLCIAVAPCHLVLRVTHPTQH
jgi:hypothetical protein